MAYKNVHEYDWSWVNPKSSKPKYTMKAKNKRPGIVVKIIKAKKGKWEIYKMKDGTFGNRLISRNGYLICSNKDFNRVESALKNIRAVQASA